MGKETVQKEEAKITTLDCFVIMPIADSDGYENGHFTKVYEDIFKPACKNAGYKAVRADEVAQTNLIHLDILLKLIESPMAICDLSSRNPNVLFELGLRQAFDKPTVLVQEVGTAKIFDIAPLRYTEYRKELRYREVLEDQGNISKALVATQEAAISGDGVNSIINILSISRPASLKDVSEGDSSGLMQLVRAEISEMRSDFRRAMNIVEKNTFSPNKVMDKESFSRRMYEATQCTREAELMIEKGMPIEMVVDMVNRAKKCIAQCMDMPINSGAREKVDELFRYCEDLALKAISKG